jgi:hypothetical protein
MCGRHSPDCKAMGSVPLTYPHSNTHTHTHTRKDAEQTRFNVPKLHGLIFQEK